MAQIANTGGLITGLLDAQRRGGPQQVDNSVPGMARRPQDSWDPLLQGAFKGVGQMTGLGDFNTSQQVLGQAQEALQGTNLETSDGMRQAAQQYQKIGQTSQAMQLIQAAKAKEAEELAMAKENMELKALNSQIDALTGIDDATKNNMKTQASSNPEMKALVQQEVMKLTILSKKTNDSWAARRQQGGLLGLTPKQLEAGRNLSSDEWNKYLEPFLDGEVQFFDTPEGLQNARIVGGRIMGKDGRLTPVPPTWKKAAAESRVQTIEDELGKAIAGIEIASLTELRAGVDEAQDMMFQNEQALKLIDEGIYSGAFADVQLGLAKVGAKLGFVGSDQIAATEAFMAQRAAAVAQIIKDFGAGTGLSDADREYALKAAGGEITMTAQAMRYIMAMSEVASRRTFGLYNDRVAQITKLRPNTPMSSFIPIEIGEKSQNLKWYEDKLKQRPYTINKDGSITVKAVEDIGTPGDEPPKKGYIHKSSNGTIVLSQEPEDE